jgi:2'-5' RNA ligase
VTAVWDDLAVLAAGSAVPQPDYSGSCMLALYPPADVAAKLATEAGLPPGEMHLTLAYTGDAADIDTAALSSVAQALSARPPVTGTVSGHARFTGGEDGDVIVALADSPAVDALRRDAESLLEAQGIGLPSEHGFTPHMTICYQDPAGPDPVGRISAFPVTFGAVTATHGDQRTSYPFSEPQAAAGWAGLREAAIR